MHIRLFILLFLGLVPLAGLAQMYSWKDASGKIHYGDRPPAGKKEAVRALAAPLPPEDAENRRKSFLEKQMAERERQQQAREAREESRKAENSPVPATPPAGEG